MTQLLTATQVAARLNCSAKWVREQAHARRMPCVRMDGLLRFDPGDLAAWIESRKVAEAKPAPVPHLRDELAAIRLRPTPERRRKHPPARRSSA